MHKKFKLIGLLILLVTPLLTPTAHAAIFSDITIDGSLNSGSISFTPSNTEDVVNGDVEFTSILAVNNDTATAKTSFDFDEYDGGLNLRALFEGQTTATYTVHGFSVTFTNIINSTPGAYFAEMQFIGDSDYDSSHPDYLSGVEIDNFVDDPLQGISFTLIFSQFEVDNYSRHVELELVYRNINDETPVVPVPAAAPMALLGFVGIALARRFRRSRG